METPKPPEQVEEVQEDSTFKLPYLFYMKRKTVLLSCFSQIFLTFLFQFKSGILFQECFDAKNVSSKTDPKTNPNLKTLQIFLFALWSVYYVLGGLVAWKRSLKLANIFLIISIPVFVYQFLPWWAHPVCTEERGLNWLSLGLNAWIVLFVGLLAIDYKKIEKITGGKPYSILYL